jgi:arylsulfatase A-like enzyme
VVTGDDLAKRYEKFGGYERSYYGCVSGIDDQVGRLRARLRELGVADDTVVFFCSDNGPEGNDKAPGQAKGLRGRKRDLYEGGIRVPGLLEWPAKVKPTVVTETPAFTSDLLPSVLEITAQELPDDRPLDGTSLLPLLTDPKTPRGKPLGFKYTRRSAWMDGDWKIVRPSDKATWELYHLGEDIGEQTNLATKHPERVKEMSAAWEAWLTSVKASAAGKDY